MKFQQRDLDLFSDIKRRYHASTGRCTPTALSIRAELLWAGEHYLLVRTGPKQYGREVEIWSREMLLLRRGSRGNAMMEIALATLDPTIREWRGNTRRVLHQVGSSYHQFKSRRWGKGLLTDLIAHAKKLNYEFEDRLEAFKKQRASEHAFSQGICNYVERSGFKVQGNLERNGIAFPVGLNYQFEILPNWSKKLTFLAARDGTVKVTLTEAVLDGPEFELLVAALRSIREKREFEIAKERSVV